MKVTYEFETWEKTALNRHKFCPNCGAHIYKICHTLQPYLPYAEGGLWYVECAECGFEGPSRLTKKYAMQAWKRCEGNV